jgi:hypothetical protein
MGVGCRWEDGEIGVEDAGLKEERDELLVRERVQVGAFLSRGVVSIVVLQLLFLELRVNEEKFDWGPGTYIFGAFPLPRNPTCLLEPRILFGFL